MDHSQGVYLNAYQNKDDSCLMLLFAVPAPHRPQTSHWTPGTRLVNL